MYQYKSKGQIATHILKRKTITTKNYDYQICFYPPSRIHDELMNIQEKKSKKITRIMIKTYCY